MSSSVDTRPIRFLRTLDGQEFLLGLAGVKDIGIYSAESNGPWIAIWVDDELEYRINIEAVAWFQYMPSKPESKPHE